MDDASEHILYFFESVKSSQVFLEGMGPFSSVYGLMALRDVEELTRSKRDIRLRGSNRMVTLRIIEGESIEMEEELSSVLTTLRSDISANFVDSEMLPEVKARSEVNVSSASAGTSARLLPRASCTRDVCKSRAPYGCPFARPRSS